MGGETNQPTNSGRATVRDVLTAVLNLNERIDETNQRINGALIGQQGLLKEMITLHKSVDKLEHTTNDRLHEMEADIAVLKRPWLILKSGWSKAVAVGGFGAAISGTIVKLGLWRFLPF